MTITHLQTCIYVCRTFCAVLQGASYNQNAAFVVLTKALLSLCVPYIYIHTHTHTQYQRALCTYTPSSPPGNGRTHCVQGLATSQPWLGEMRKYGTVRKHLNLLVENEDDNQPFRFQFP